VAVAGTIKTKKRCCGSSPRCKRCPVVLKRLSKAGHAERLDARLYVIHAPKRAVKKARKR
jgi:hypothetical protein